ncbi:transcriptional regulator AraC family [Vibrio variabilis]|uniref:Transcriptional regulator AraC family n=1 Tax=Vibrio variabilis TaxID=990271 RepID=A0ABQ0J7K7_9VIBR|nr:transcriptional regulator AraC family [Vibrio variabilis]
MKAIKENVLCTTESFAAYQFEGQNFNHPYHFHHQIEIVVILQSSGKLVVGDHIAPYQQGDIYILGSNLPHAFICSSRAKTAKSLVIQFERNCFGDQFFELPEFKSVNLLLEQAALGVKIVGNEQEAASLHHTIRKTCYSDGLDAIIHLLKLLNELSQIEHLETVLDKFHKTEYSFETHRLNNAINWIDTHYSQPIQLAEVAHLTSLTENAFCRAFKKATGKTFLQYLNDIRVHEAAQLLIESNRSVTDIAYDVGFTNISSFNRYFKKIKGVSPSDLRKQIFDLEESNVNQ